MTDLPPTRRSVVICYLATLAAFAVAVTLGVGAAVWMGE